MSGRRVKDDLIDSEGFSGYSDAHTLPSVEFYEPVMEQPEDNSENVAQLTDGLTSSRQPFSLLDISAVRSAFEAVGLENCTGDQVDQFLARLPRIEHPEDHTDTFALFAFLCQRRDFAEQILRSRILQSVDFGFLPSCRYQPLQTSVCETMSILMKYFLETASSDPLSAPGYFDEGASFFVGLFFNPFVELCCSENVWAFSFIDTLLVLGKRFSVILGRDGVHELDRLVSGLYIRFIHHTHCSIEIPAIAGLVQIIDMNPDIVSRHVELHGSFGVQLIDRLTFLGGQENSLLCNVTVSLLTRLLANTDMSATYNLIAQMIQSALHFHSRDYSRSNIIYFLGWLIGSLQDFRCDPIQELITIFIVEFPSLRRAEKTEGMYVIANIFGFCESDVIAFCCAQDRFVDALLEVLEIDNEEGLFALFNGLYRGLQQVDGRIRLDTLDRLFQALDAIDTEGAGEKFCRVKTLLMNAIHSPLA
jgi:hypothetical protein